MKKKIFALVLSLFILTALISVHVSAQGEVTYTVTFNGNSLISNLPSQTVVSGGLATRPADPVVEHYTFIRWATNAAGTNSYDFAKPVTDNLTLYAIFARTRWTVSFNTNGGSIVAAQSVNDGSKAAKPSDPTKTGYTFTGWYSDSGLTTEYDFTSLVTAAATLYAKWTPVSAVTHTVIFNSEGGTAVASQTVYEGTLAAKPTDPTKAGNTFAGWYSDSGLTTEYDFTSPVAAAMTLYAKWTAQASYTVTFNANKGSGIQMAQQSFNYNSGMGLQACTYTRKGYTFSGWNTKADGTGTAVGDGADGSTLSADGTNVTLYAQWTLIQYKITYNLDGGAMPQGKTNPTEYTVETSDFTINNPERVGYEFKGWQGTGIQGRSDNLLIKTNSTGDRTYTAVWQAMKYNISFNPGDHGKITRAGVPLAAYNDSIDYNTDFPVFNTETPLGDYTLTANAGYTFAGWKDGNGNAPGAKVTGDASYTAQWTVNTNTAYKVQFLSENISNPGLMYDVIHADASKTGTTDAAVDISALVNEFPIPGYHYINEADYYIHSNITTQKPVGQDGVKVMGDGSLVIMLYYTENSFVKLTLAVNNANRGSIQKYSDGFYLAPATGSSKDINVNVVSGCTFEKWVYTDAAHSTPTDVPNAISPTLTAAQIDSVAKDTGIYEPITFTAIINEPTATYNYSVSSAGGGTVTKDTETIDSVTGEAAGSTAVPATGYDFEKWIYTTDGTTASTSAAFVPGKVNGAYAGANYEAVFKKQTFAVNVSAAPLGSGTVTGTGTFEYGTGTTLTAAPAAGYHFSSWSLNGMPAGTDASLVISNIKEIRNYTAQFEGNQYTVKFNKNFEGSGAMNDETFKYGTSKNLTANSFERAGYTFSSWNTRDDGKGTSFADTADIAKINLATAAADNTITLYAQWTLASYHINYVLNGGTNNQINPGTYNAESDITLADPTRNGYTFAGWTGSNGTTAQRSVHIQTGSSGNKSYTAAWTANKYYVYYQGNGGNGSMEESELTYDTEDILRKNSYKREYKVRLIPADGNEPSYYDLTAADTFAGWTLNEDGTGKVYQDGEKVSNLSTGESVTLYAKWTHGSIELPLPVRTGYTFQGWRHSADGTNYDAHSSYSPISDDESFEGQWISVRPLTGDIKITGDKQLTAELDSTAGAEQGRDYHVQWYRVENATPTIITGADKLSYEITKKDFGKTLKVELIADRAGSAFEGTLSQEFNVPAKMPEQPELHVVIDDTTASLQWTAPFDGGDEITGYTIVVYQANELCGRPITVKASDLSYTITGLERGTDYTFMIEAVNGIGTGTSEKMTISIPEDTNIPTSNPTAIPASKPIAEDGKKTNLPSDKESESHNDKKEVHFAEAPSASSADDNDTLKHSQKNDNGETAEKEAEKETKKETKKVKKETKEVKKETKKVKKEWFGWLLIVSVVAAITIWIILKRKPKK